MFRRTLTWISVVIILAFSILAYELSDFPNFFADEGRQVYIVIGKEAKTDDVIGGISVAVTLTTEYMKNSKNIPPIAVFDTEINEYNKYDMVVVGGPCVNSAAAYLMGHPNKCTQGFEPGTSRIRIYEQDTGKIALLVAGYTGFDTTRAAYVLSHFRDYNSSLQGKTAIIETSMIKETTVS